MADGGRDLMLAATRLLRPGPARVGSLGRIGLPRSVPVRSLVAWAVGGAVGLLAGAVMRAVIGGLGPLAAGLVAGAALAHLAVVAEPLPGEHLLTWLQLTSAGRQRRVAGAGRRLCVVVLPAGDPPPSGGWVVAAAGDLVAWAAPADRRLQHGATLAVGTCALEEVVVGPVRVTGGLVEVAPGSVDERGRPVGAARPPSGHRPDRRRRRRGR
jgi:hypothetical protein